MKKNNNSMRNIYKITISKYLDIVYGERTTPSVVKHKYININELHKNNIIYCSKYCVECKTEYNGNMLYTRWGWNGAEILSRNREMKTNIRGS